MGNDPCRLMLLPVASVELAKPMLLTPYAILLRKPFARAYTFASLGTLAHILLWVPHTHVANRCLYHQVATNYIARDKAVAG